MIVISEPEFRMKILTRLGDRFQGCGCVTGPGRSGAIAAVYASHILRIPFIPYKQVPPETLGKLLIIDTAMETGATIRKAEAWYRNKGVNTQLEVLYHEPPRVVFWYESSKPQRYRHE